MAEAKQEPSAPTAGERAFQRDIYILQCDGGARGHPGPAALGVVLKDPSGKVVRLSKYLGETTNNVAEYEALNFGLWLAQKKGARKVIILMDSELVVKQLNGEYKVEAHHLKFRWRRARKLLEGFDYYDIRHIPRELNGEADALVNWRLDRATGIKRSRGRSV